MESFVLNEVIEILHRIEGVVASFVLLPKLACRTAFCLSVSSKAGENVSCSIPDGVPIDITVKLMVCLVHLNILEPLNVSDIKICTSGTSDQICIIFFDRKF